MSLPELSAGDHDGMDVTMVCERWERLWNERDPVARLGLLEMLCEEGVVLVDPGNDVAGRQAVSDAIAGVQARTPGMRFRLTGPVDAHHNVVRVGWETAAGDTSRSGIDVFVLSPSGRITTALGFKDSA
ncbi:nuclear transport factor 2 family protein [Actinomadura rubrisoli]|uniref:Nuclear transport factor 2 family protein n=1 Tax=Actinomadura rubrisoli TaxID=2530368 RepID=A0A4R5BEQ6_9ACTN|nr:nuclear transport factor 2 family protein [Actinomadura rubrisoli]TDD84095.1 nuclear transport factor 2 family protein [Actinomadura rubrisoli]